VSTRAPTLLLSQGSFKLLVFVENSSTGQLHIYRYPGGHEFDKTRSADFLKMLVLVLLCAREFSELRPSSSERLFGDSANVLREIPTAEKPIRPNDAGLRPALGGKTSMEAALEFKSHASTQYPV
jgi:hypothetical protein